MLDWISRFPVVAIWCACAAVASAASEPVAEAPPLPPELACPSACETVCASATCDSPADPFVGKRLTGNWGGVRTSLADAGVDFEFFSTQFYQGVVEGGLDQGWEYGGKLDYLLHVQGGKAIPLEGFFLDLHAETRYGNDINDIDGLLVPANLSMAFPKPGEEVTALTGFKLTQALSKNVVLFCGKINTLDEYPVRYDPHLVGLPGQGGFQNTSLVFDPIVARTVPYSAAGAGFAILKDAEPIFSFTVFDPEERATEGLANLYDEGVVLVTDLILRSELGGRPGIWNIGGTYSTAEYRSLDPASYLSREFLESLAARGPEAPEETGSWAVYSNFYQALWVDPCDASRNWGLFGQVGFADGNPNPLRFSASGGIGGRSMLPNRNLDTFGIGYYHLGVSEEFARLARPLRPQQDGLGVELFYNAAITPWCRLTYDFQVGRPSTVATDTMVATGLRLGFQF